jgi:hypothetical protein
MSHRCRTEPEFALSVYAQIETDREREMFLTVYRAAALRGRGSTIGETRRKMRVGTWEWDAELTVPPPEPLDVGPPRTRRPVRGCS